MMFLAMLISIIHVYLLVVITSYVPAAAQIDAECFTDYRGRDYRGTVSTTNTGKTCQRWTSQSPHEHERDPSDYSDAGLGDHNYCRNPVGYSGGAYCFTTDSSVRFEACDIGPWQVTCDRGMECFTDSLGRDYRGTVSTTNTGKTCQRWTSQSPHSHYHTPSNYSDAGLGDHNYCRNPDDDNGAWCFTTDSNVQYEKCDIGAWQVTCDRADRCQAGYTPFQDSCYKLHNETGTRAEAEGDCEPQGHLADITSSEENNFVNRLMFRSGTGHAWFGLLKTNDELIWSDGTPLVPMEWHNIYTDDERTCFRIDGNSIIAFIFGYTWNDRSCDAVYQFVCEREVKPSRTSPSSSISTTVTTKYSGGSKTTANPSGTSSSSSSISTTIVRTDMTEYSGGSKSTAKPIISTQIRIEYSGGTKSTAQYSSNLLQTSPSSTSSYPAGADELRSRSAGQIAGGVVGLIVVIAFISIILFIICRRKNRETTSPSPKLEFDGPYDITLKGTNAPPKSSNPGSNGGISHTNQTYESAIGGNDTDDIYYDVKDQSEEYAYAYAEGQNNIPQQNLDDQTYTYADIGNGSSPPVPSVGPAETSQDNEGWKKNSIYVTSDEDLNGLSTGNDDAMKQDEGWVANSIYGD